MRHLGYDPVRTDQDLGAAIIKEMIEWLAICDLVIADVNGNVDYEVGASCRQADRLRNGSSRLDATVV